MVVVATEVEDDCVRPELPYLLPDVREPVEDVGALEPGGDAAVRAASDRQDGAGPAGGADDRPARCDHERVAGDPDAELVLGAEGGPPRLRRRSVCGARSGRRGGSRRGGDGQRRGERDRRVDLVLVPSAERVLQELPRPVQQERVADAGERAGDRERDVALPAARLVERRLVHSWRVQERAVHECEHGNHEGVTGGEGPAAVLGRALAASARSRRRRM